MAEVLVYVPLYRVDERPFVLADILREHGKPLEAALRALHAEERTKIGLDEIVVPVALTDSDDFEVFVREARS